MIEELLLLIVSLKVEIQILNEKIDRLEARPSIEIQLDTLPVRYYDYKNRRYLECRNVLPRKFGCWQGDVEWNDVYGEERRNEERIDIQRRVEV